MKIMKFERMNRKKKLIKMYNQNLRSNVLKRFKLFNTSSNALENITTVFINILVFFFYSHFEVFEKPN